MRFFDLLYICGLAADLGVKLLLFCGSIIEHFVEEISNEALAWHFIGPQTVCLKILLLAVHLY